MEPSLNNAKPERALASPARHPSHLSTTEPQPEIIQIQEPLGRFLPQQREDIVRIANTVLVHLKEVLLCVWMTLKGNGEESKQTDTKSVPDQPCLPFSGYDSSKTWVHFRAKKHNLCGSLIKSLRQVDLKLNSFSLFPQKQTVVVEGCG